jgi:hypothetical protein
LQTIDGLGPTASNTVVLAVPIDVLDAVSAYTRALQRSNGRMGTLSVDPSGAAAREMIAAGSDAS